MRRASGRAHRLLALELIMQITIERTISAAITELAGENHVAYTPLAWSKRTCVTLTGC